MDTDYLLEIRVKNGKISKLMEDAGITSVRQLAERANISEVALGKIINMRTLPLKKTRRTGEITGEWKVNVQRLADFFEVNPADLFTTEMLNSVLNHGPAKVYLDTNQMISLTGLHENELPSIQPRQVAAVSEKEIQSYVASLIESGDITPRQVEVLRARFGFDGPEETFREIADRLSISHERVRQIEATALRKIRLNLLRSGRYDDYANH